MNQSAGDRVNLLGLPRAELEAFVAERFGAKPFRARQLMKWIYRRGAADFSEMTDLAKDFRTELEAGAKISVPKIVTSQISSDGTRKWMLRMDEVQGIETVFIPEPGRGTLCISSQVGCAMDCSFCATAQQGFNRNLSVAEIVGQVWLARHELAAAAARGDPTAEGRNITNIVFMGMGEPLANYRNVLPAMRIFLDDLGYDLSRRRVTLSTSGLVPQIYKLAEECNVALAVSLHAPNDELRNELVPINRKHPIRELLAACWHYIEKQNGRSVTFEYVMLDGINDGVGHARELARLLRGRPAKLNLIPFNAFPGTSYRRSADGAIIRFRDVLNELGVIATIRRTRGDDIDAACGQLAGRVTDRLIVRLGMKLPNHGVRTEVVR
ncbi:MAG: 23S rRNA (adenine(2503)-C(2))-methyltransferase RlmN [Gammaproteobacteria bacterium]|nr:23S rRNA (adenine(2503)-C(2))-methyltransferase RlmN [Gammaproteobacteria bacterium]MDE2350061.1 23S rRNA (adenine(2503)-C(2))-methyltransferase RlmN [Gammaproteobacteria bacterium]